MMQPADPKSGNRVTLSLPTFPPRSSLGSQGQPAPQGGHGNHKEGMGDAPKHSEHSHGEGPRDRTAADLLRRSEQSPATDSTSGLARLKALAHQRRQSPSNTNAPASLSRIIRGPPMAGSTQHMKGLSDGFASPNKAQVVRETTREEMLRHVKQHKAARPAASGQPAQPAARAASAAHDAHDTTRDTKRDAHDTAHDAHDSMAEADEEDVERLLDQYRPSRGQYSPSHGQYSPSHEQYHHDHLANEGQPWTTQHQQRHETTTGPHSTHVAYSGPKEAVPIQDTRSVEDLRLDAIIRDVAARIIQTHWRTFQQGRWQGRHMRAAPPTANASAVPAEPSHRITQTRPRPQTSAVHGASAGTVAPSRRHSIGPIKQAGSGTGSTKGDGKDTGLLSSGAGITRADGKDTGPSRRRSLGHTTKPTATTSAAGAAGAAAASGAGITRGEGASGGRMVRSLSPPARRVSGGKTAVAATSSAVPTGGRAPPPYKAGVAGGGAPARHLNAVGIVESAAPVGRGGHKVYTILAGPVPASSAATASAPPGRAPAAAGPTPGHAPAHAPGRTVSTDPAMAAMADLPASRFPAAARGGAPAATLAAEGSYGNRSTGIKSCSSQGEDSLGADAAGPQLAADGFDEEHVPFDADFMDADPPYDYQSGQQAAYGDHSGEATYDDQGGEAIYGDQRAKATYGSQRRAEAYGTPLGYGEAFMGEDPSFGAPGEGDGEEEEEVYDGAPGGVGEAGAAGMDAPTLLRKLAAGDVPEGIDQEQLLLLLSAIESAQLGPGARESEQQLGEEASEQQLEGEASALRQLGVEGSEAGPQAEAFEGHGTYPLQGDEVVQHVREETTGGEGGDVEETSASDCTTALESPPATHVADGCHTAAAQQRGQKGVRAMDADASSAAGQIAGIARGMGVRAQGAGGGGRQPERVTASAGARIGDSVGARSADGVAAGVRGVGGVEGGVKSTGGSGREASLEKLRLLRRSSTGQTAASSRSSSPGPSRPGQTDLDGGSSGAIAAPAHVINQHAAHAQGSAQHGAHGQGASKHASGQHAAHAQASAPHAAHGQAASKHASGQHAAHAQPGSKHAHAAGKHAPAPGLHKEVDKGRTAQHKGEPTTKLLHASATVLPVLHPATTGAAMPAARLPPPLELESSAAAPPADSTASTAGPVSLGRARSGLVTDEDDLSVIDSELRASQTLLPHGVVLVRRAPSGPGDGAADGTGARTSRVAKPSAGGGGGAAGAGRHGQAAIGVGRYAVAEEEVGREGSLTSPASTTGTASSGVNNARPAAASLRRDHDSDQLLPDAPPAAGRAAAGGATGGRQASERATGPAAAAALADASAARQPRSSAADVPSVPGAAPPGMQARRQTEPATGDGPQSPQPSKQRGSAGDAPHYVWKSPLSHADPDRGPDRVRPSSSSGLAASGTTTLDHLASQQQRRTLDPAPQQQRRTLDSSLRAGPGGDDAPDTSMTAEKLSNILAFLDEVEQRSLEDEARPPRRSSAVGTHDLEQRSLEDEARPSSHARRNSAVGVHEVEQQHRLGDAPARLRSGASVHHGTSGRHAPRSSATELAAEPSPTSSWPTEPPTNNLHQQPPTAVHAQPTQPVLASPLAPSTALPVPHPHAPAPPPPPPAIMAALTTTTADALLQRVGLLTTESSTASLNQEASATSLMSLHLHQEHSSSSVASLAHMPVAPHPRTSLVAHMPGIPAHPNNHTAGAAVAAGTQAVGGAEAWGSTVSSGAEACGHGGGDSWGHGKGPVGAVGEAAWGVKPANLAESVYDGVKSKLKKLQEDVRERDSVIAMLKRELESVQHRAAVIVTDTEARASEALGAARAEHEAALARHLSFMDRLLADKDELNRKVLATTEAMQACEQRHERALTKLKDGWATELRRQKEAWVASERTRREQWMEAKTAEVKELTVKGLEVEVQKLLARHKAELSAVQSGSAEEVRRTLDVVAAQHELNVRQVREKMTKDHEDALEKERAASQQRVREVSERYEQQLGMQRLRLVSDGDIRLEQLEAARREERKRQDDALSRVTAECDERVRAVEEESRRERDAMRRAHDKQLESLREEQGTEQEGWRAAVAERARRELSDREAALVERLTRERDQQIQVVVQRLEAEATAAREAIKADAARREQATAARHAAALKDAQRVEMRLQEQLRMASSAHQAAESQLSTCEAALEVARREAGGKGLNHTLAGGTGGWGGGRRGGLRAQVGRALAIHWLEAQVSAAQDQARTAEAGRAAAGDQAVKAVLTEKEAVERQLAAARQEVAEARAQHAHEMNHVEARVKEALVRKDESLSTALQQLAALTSQLRQTEAVLAAQQAELGSL